MMSTVKTRLCTKETGSSMQHDNVWHLTRPLSDIACAYEAYVNRASSGEMIWAVYELFMRSHTKAKPRPK